MARGDALSTLQLRLERVVHSERNAWAYNRQSDDPPAPPAVFQVELTNHCPMRCEMCPRTHRMSRPLGYMDRAVYERIIDHATCSTSKLFLHHFGDSLMHPDVGEY